MNILGHLIGKVDAVIDNFVFQGFAVIQSRFAFTFTSLVILSIILLGIAYLQQAVEISLKNLVSFYVKVAVIAAFVLSTTLFNDLFYYFFFDSADTVAGWLLESSDDLENIGSVAILDYIYSVLMSSAMVLIVELSGFSSDGLSALVLGVVIGLIAILVVGRAAYLVVASKIGLALMMVISPIMISLLLFDKTKSITQAWIQQSINFMLVPFFVYMVFAFIYILSDATIQDIRAAADGKTMIDTVSIVTLAIIMSIAGGFLSQVTSISQSLAGGVALGTSNLSMGLSSSTAGIAAGGAYAWQRFRRRSPYQKGGSVVKS